MMMEVLKGPLKDLVDTKVGVIRTWIDEGRMKPIDPYHLVFMIWATTQHYADFEIQIEAITGHSVREPKFRKGAEETLKTLFLKCGDPVRSVRWGRRR